MGVDDSQFPTPYSGHGTQGSQPNSFRNTSTGLSPSTAGCSKPPRLRRLGGGRALPLHILCTSPCRVRFGLLPFQSPLLRECHLVSLPPPTKMLQFGGFPLLTEHHGSRRNRDRKSHSGISGSKAACAYPELIAACRALLQHLSQAIRQTA